MNTLTQINYGNKNKVAHFELVKKVLQYEHPELVDKLQNKLNLSKNQAKALFEDTKRFLFICGTQSGDFTPTSIIDEGWHNFILFTRDYSNFCRLFFNKFIHHQPTNKQVIEKANFVENTLSSAQLIFGNLSTNWSYSRAAFCVPSGECSGSSGDPEPAPADCATNG